MEKNVQQLLQAEQEVNAQIKQAMDNKKARLGLIQKEVEQEVAQFKLELEKEKNEKIAQVSGMRVLRRVHPFDIHSLFSV